MNTKTIIVVLAVACVGLGIALIAIKIPSDSQHARDASSIVDFSNQVVNADQHIDSLNQVNLSLTNDLMLSQQQATELSNSLATAASHPGQHQGIPGQHAGPGRHPHQPGRHPQYASRGPAVAKQ